ncbi:GM26699 [Drosophila sechellia]|uniref:GM26699 n=1 Tax=Drosophila sechellia TaxID=7238 RepID=B4IM11_DROSE|nr:GM26699 [Drosophila sechellia]
MTNKLVRLISKVPCAKGEITGSLRPIKVRRKYSSGQSTREKPYVRKNSRGEDRRELRGQDAPAQSEWNLKAKE